MSGRDCVCGRRGGHSKMSMRLEAGKHRAAQAVVMNLLHLPGPQEGSSLSVLAALQTAGSLSTRTRASMSCSCPCPTAPPLPPHPTVPTPLHTCTFSHVRQPASRTLRCAAGLCLHSSYSHDHRHPRKIVCQQCTPPFTSSPSRGNERRAPSSPLPGTARCTERLWGAWCASLKEKALGKKLASYKKSVWG